MRNKTPGDDADEPSLSREYDVPGEYSEIEEAILKYLYENPDAVVGTVNLADILRPVDGEPRFGDEEFKKGRAQAVDEVQYGIETLISTRLVAGKRVAHYGKVQFAQLELTTKGEAEAIQQRRRPTKVVVRVIGQDSPQ
jgi:hypothetical protein